MKKIVLSIILAVSLPIGAKEIAKEIAKENVAQPAKKEVSVERPFVSNTKEKIVVKNKAVQLKNQSYPRGNIATH